jgi:hypothetical protein
MPSATGGRTILGDSCWAGMLSSIAISRSIIISLVWQDDRLVRLLTSLDDAVVTNNLTGVGEFTICSTRFVANPQIRPRRR